MRIASFNIRGGRMGGRGNVSRLVEACAGLDADVLGLQEVDRHRRRTGYVDQAARVARGLGCAHVYGPTRRRVLRGEYGNALVVRGAIRDAEIRVLPGAGGQQRRVAVLARVDVESISMSVAVTHLQHHPRRLAHLPDEAPDQLRAVLSWLGSRPSPRVVIGDLNLTPARAEPILSAAGFTIAATGPAFPSDAPRLQLDYVAVDGGLHIDAASVVPTGDLSDHHPIVVEVSPAH